MDSVSATAAAPPVTLTPLAVERIRRTMAEQRMEGHVLRVGVVPGGCSGSQYDLDIVAQPRPDDVTFEQDGVRVAVAAAAAPVLVGTVIDFFDDGMRAGFSFKNPNARATCGCGTSFQA